MRFSKAITAIVTVSIILLIINSIFLQKSYTQYTLSNYNASVQEYLLQKTPTRIVSATQPKDNSTSEILKFMEKMQTQMQLINNNILNLKEWSDYKSHREILERTLDDTFDPKNVTKTNPRILLSDINVDSNTNYKVIFLVTSFAKHFERRILIRELWGNATMWSNKEQWKVIFNVGTVKIDAGSIHRQLREESKKYKDIFMVDIEDNFYLLSEKVMIALDWFFHSFKFDFILKSDDDVFVQVDHSITALKNEWKDEHYIGFVTHNAYAKRTGRYAVSFKEWYKKLYDPFCSGGGYILSQTIIGRMIPNFNWKTPLKIDDAYIGSIVKVAGASPLNAKGFKMYNELCQYATSLIVSHPAKKKDCQNFMMRKSLIEQGRLVDDALYEPGSTTKKTKIKV